MSPVLTEILIILVLIVANGTFAMSEAALISARKIRLQQRADEGDENARTALDLANFPGSFLATAQIGITLIGILTGAVSGATISKEIAQVIGTIPILAPYSELLAFTVVVAVITYISLIVGELVPKNLALNNPEGVAISVAKPMRLLSRIAAPLVKLLDRSTALTLRILGVKPSAEPTITEDEIRIMIRQGTQTGTFEEVERHMVEQVFRFGDLRVGAIMTPRTEIVPLDITDDQAAIQKQIAEHGFSQYPVVHNHLDNVIGVVRLKDLYARLLQEKSIQLATIMRKPLFVPESTFAHKMLEILRREKTDIAFIIDEYGGLQGLVTLGDIFKNIAGDIFTETDGEEPMAIRRDDGSWLLDGLLPIDKLHDLLQIREEVDEYVYHTLGGFVFAQIGHVPRSGEFFEVHGYRFEVVDMDGNRIDKVLVMPAKSELQ